MIPILSQILMDRESLIYYENNKVVEWNDVLRRLKLQERKKDRQKPDHFYAGASCVNLEKIDSLSDLLSKGICRLGNHYLDLKNDNKVFIRSEKFVNWQQVCCQLTPLVLQCGVLYKTLPVSNDLAVLQQYMQSTLKNNLHFTAIPSPDIPELNSIMKEGGGFHDLHIHLNGASETDLLWQHILCNPSLIARDLDSVFRNNELAKEQAEQEEVNFSGKVFLRRINRAIEIRRKIVAYLLNRDSLPMHHGHPVFLYIGITPSKADPDLILAAEALFYMLTMKELELNKDKQLANFFHQYLLTLGMVNRFAVQQVYQLGFDQFQKITVNNFRENYERFYNRRYYQWSGANLEYLSFMEGRFSPKNTPVENRKLLTNIINGWERYIKTYTQHHQQNKGTIQNLPRLCLVAHFIKKKDIEYDKHEDWETVIRWKKLRIELKNKAMALILIKKHPRFSQYLTGIDAAANEMDTPPEVFAPTFRLLRNKGFNHFTFHAGEDFRHILSGLRAMFEAVLFLQLKSGDRLGHGTAAGIPPSLWVERMGANIYISQGEWLDNLLFIRHFLTTVAKKTSSELSNLIPKVESCISNLCASIYGQPFSCFALTEAWLLRSYDPIIILNPQKLNEWNSTTKQYKEDELCFVEDKLKNNEIKSIAQLYHYKKIRTLYDKMIMLNTEELLNEKNLFEIQQIMLDFLNSKNIILESLPTSNLRISFYHHLNEHHIERWINPNEKSKRPSIVLGTDDTGIFCTNIYNEYAHVYQKLLEMGYTSSSATDIMRQLNDMGKVYRFDENRI